VTATPKRRERKLSGGTGLQAEACLDRFARYLRNWNTAASSFTIKSGRYVVGETDRYAVHTCIIACLEAILPNKLAADTRVGVRKLLAPAPAPESPNPPAAAPGSEFPPLAGWGPASSAPPPSTCLRAGSALAKIEGDFVKKPGAQMIAKLAKAFGNIDH